jgi:outer membrane receptor protein involved in Fe transport
MQLLATASVIGMGTAALSTPAMAQTKAAAETIQTAQNDRPAPAVAGAPAAVVQDTGPGGGGSVGEITVTASRVNRQGYTAPTPTVTVSTVQMEQRATVNIGQYLDEVPAFRPTTQPTTNGINQRSVGSVYLDLRGLGSSRTLILVDGQRFVPEMAAGLAGYNVNLNQIPSLLLDHVEVVTGGASAQWGSDAVAGVVNLILKHKFTGIQAEVQGGVSQRGDDTDERIGVVAGTNFLHDRGNLTVAFDYENNGGVGDVNTRDWGKKHGYLIPNPCPGSAPVSATCPKGGNGLATNLLLNDVQFSNGTPGGLITNTALKGTVFGPGGTISTPFQYGNFVGPTYMQGGGNTGLYYPNGQPIAAPYNRWETYARASYEITDSIEAHAEASYAYSKGGGFGGGGGVSTATIRNDNPFLPAAIKTQMQQLGITNFSLGNYISQYLAEGDIRNRTTRGVFGVDGSFGKTGNWKWSADVGYGINRYSQFVNGGNITANYNFAVDAVLYNGVPTCRALVPGSSTYNPTAAAGCVPVNLIGPSPITQSAHNYISGFPSSDIDYDQFFANGNVSGEPFSTWAGPVSVAAGVQYRHENENAWSDPISAANGYGGNNAPKFRGSYGVKEVFGETVIPLLKESRFGQSFELNGAVRYADYDGAAGGQVPWKVGVTYRPITGLLLRAARSRDIRAPNVFEQNVPASGRNATVKYGTAQPTVLTYTVGNPQLQPEKADTTTYGFSYQPPFAPGFAFSVDHYDIDTFDLISTLAAQDVVDLCLKGGVQSFCNLITFTNPQTPTLPNGVSTPYLNLSSVKLAGWDFQASYRLPLSGLPGGFPGSVQLTFNGSYAEHVLVNSGALGAATFDRAGENGPKNQFAVPRFRDTISANYSNDKWGVGLQARQVSGGNYDNTFGPADINNNKVPGATYIDLNGTYTINARLSLFAVANNIFDAAPPLAPTDNASPTNAAYYDPIGRLIKVGLRLKLQ